MNRTYRIIIDVTDFGPFVSTILLPMPQAITAEGLEDGSFSVYVEKREIPSGKIAMTRESFESEELFPSIGYVDVEKAYVCDYDGNQVDEGEYVALKLPTSPFYRLTSELIMIDMYNYFAFSDFTITQTKDIKAGNRCINGLLFDRQIKRYVPQKQGWVNGVSKASIPLEYGYFSPMIGHGLRPLIIWLHGAGEGGGNPELAYYGNNVLNLSKDTFQSYFGGTYVLVPQTPTYWLDDGEGVMSLSGESIYSKPLMELIEEFISLHDDIDRDRVYIGGCSNGGFMTMRMILDYPDYFAGAYPVCEAMLDEKISENDIEKLMKTPIWFTHAKNDTLVQPEKFVVPTYERLVKAGHNDVHFSYFDTVIDSRGYRYDNFGHASWIHMLNDDCDFDYDGQEVIKDGEKVSLLQWLSKLKK